MRIIISLVIVCLFSINLRGQSKQNNQLEVAIRSSLSLYINQRKDAVKEAIEKNRLFISTTNNSVYFEPMVEGISLKYIHLQNLPLYKKLLKKGVDVVSLDSIELKKNQLTIVFTCHFAKLKKGILSMKIKESTSFIYEYSCAKEEWLYVRQNMNTVEAD